MKVLRLLMLLVLSSVSILFFSCKKTTQIGQGVLPINDIVNAVSTDTFTIISQVETELPVITSSESQYLLGSMKDPVFGTSYAGIFTQVQLPGGENDYSFGDSVHVDSVVLSLPYYGSVPYYGIQNIPQSIKVYRVTQNMVYGTSYYSNQAFSYNPIPIGVKNSYVPNVNSFAKDSPVILGDTLGPQLRIKLSNAFVQDLISQTSTGAFASNTTFQNFLKGIYIAPDTSLGFGGGMMYLDLTSAAINVYGKKDTATTETIIASFPINSTSNVSTNYYKHNYTGTPILPLLSANAPTKDSVLYLQSMGGLRAKITIPYLKNLGKVLVNKAEIELVQLNRNPSIIDTNFTAPAQVEILTDSANNNYSLEDYSNEFLTYGGNKVRTTIAPGDTVAEYSVSIADQLQYILNGNPTGSTVNYSQFTSLFLRTYPNPEIADRIIVGGGNANKYKLVLHLVYTKLK